MSGACLTYLVTWLSCSESFREAYSDQGPLEYGSCTNLYQAGALKTFSGLQVGVLLCFLRCLQLDRCNMGAST